MSEDVGGIIQGIYFDGRKDKTLVKILLVRCTKKIQDGRALCHS